MKKEKNNYKICIIGQGVVGYDLALTFSKKYPVIGYEKNLELVRKIKLKSNTKELNDSKAGYYVTFDEEEILCANVYVITVETPIDKYNEPDLKNLLDATKLVSNKLTPNNIVVFESTVYPGLTEEKCIPLLEKHSKLKLNKDFFVGFSPERINDGENKKKANDVIKITSGSNKESGLIINRLYNSVIDAGTFLVSSIKIAEATKILENCQRDVNIALMNEYSKFLKKINVDTSEVLKAANTKWNFSNYKPGLVGGSCIPVDPYYLIHKSREVKLEMPLIETARNVNENMLEYVYNQIESEVKKIKQIKILMIGVAYKENSIDFRNSMYLKLAKLLSKNYTLDILEDNLQECDSLSDEIRINVECRKKVNYTNYNMIIIGTPHSWIKKIVIEKKIAKDAILIDINGLTANADKKIL